MKLLTELHDAQVTLEEGADGKRKLFVEGVFLQQNIKNRNGRVYPGPILEREVNRYSREMIATKRAMGELGHPSNPSVNLERVSHLVTECRRDGDNYVGRALIIDTPYGKIAESLVTAGVTLGVSSRAMGSLKYDKNLGANVVQEDLNLRVMIDIVADPSAPSAFVNGVMENVSWRVNELGEWVAETFDAIKADVHRAPAHELAEAKVKAWEEFLTKLNETQEAGIIARRLGVDPAEAVVAMKRARMKYKAMSRGGSMRSEQERDRAVYAMVKTMLGK